VAVFVFGNTMKTIFEAIIFLFVTASFRRLWPLWNLRSTGNKSGLLAFCWFLNWWILPLRSLTKVWILEFQVIVEEMNIMTTVFLCYDNLKIYYPKSQTVYWLPSRFSISTGVLIWEKGSTSPFMLPHLWKCWPSWRKERDAENFPSLLVKFSKQSCWLL
jgi:hypothetical protein